MTESDLKKTVSIIVHTTMRFACEFALEHEEQFKQWLENKRKNEVKEK